MIKSVSILFRTEKFWFWLIGTVLVLTLAIAIAQNWLWGISALVLVVMVTILTLNPKIGLVLILLGILGGQVLRFSLPIGGAIVANDILIPLIFLILVFLKLVQRKLPVPDNALTWPLSVFILVALVSLLFNVHNFILEEFFASFAYWLRLLTAFLVFFLVLSLISTHSAWQKFYSFIIWLGLAFAMLGFLQLVFVPSFEFMSRYGWDPHLNRLLSTFFDPNFAGGFLVLASSLVTARLLFAENIALKGLLFFALIFLIFAILLTYSRSSYLAFAVSLLVIGALKSPRLLLLGGVVLLVLFLTFPRAQERIAGGFQLDITAKQRLRSFGQAYEIIQDYPILGAGFNTLRFIRADYGQIEDPKEMVAGGFDSSFLTILATTGVVGLAAFFWLGWRMLKESFQTFRDKNSPSPLRALGLGIFAGFLGLIVHSQFVNSLLYPHIMIYIWFVLGLFFSGKLLYQSKNLMTKPKT